MEAHFESPPFELGAGALCLDFANTLGDRPRCSEEKLAGYDDLLRWSRQAQCLPQRDLDRLARLAAREPRAARRVFRRALSLRETVYRIFGRLAGGREPAAEDLASLNGALPGALRRLEIQARPEAFAWEWGGPPDALDRPLWPVLRSAAELLTSAEAGRVRECASEVCSWLFVDRSRNRRRRWCDMSTCGNRAKARRHYRRRKRAGSAAPGSARDGSRCRP